MRFLITVLLLLSAFTLSAQSYIRFNIGYALPLNSELIGEETHSSYNPNTGQQTESIKGIYGSYGSGFSFHAAFGNSFGESILGYDLEIGYLIGKTNKVTSTVNNGNSINTSEEESQSKSFQFAPAFSFTANTGKIQPYSRIGPVIGFTTMSFSQNIDDDYISISYEAKNTVSIGLKGALGINFSPTKKTQFFSEMNFISLSNSPKEAEISKFIIDGVNELENLDDKTVAFEKDYKISDTSNELVETREKYSMGSISIQVGVRISLN